VAWTLRDEEEDLLEVAACRVEKGATVDDDRLHREIPLTPSRGLDLFVRSPVFILCDPKLVLMVAAIDCVAT